MYVCMYVCLYVFQPFVQGLLLVEILTYDSGSGTHLTQDAVTSNAGAWLTNATGVGVSD